MIRPWMPFYTRDWLDNKELRRCSPAARSVLIDLMCLAHEGEPYGYLADESGPLTQKYMASRCMISARKFTESLQELMQFQRVSSTKSDDFPTKLFITRMVEDERVRAARAAGGAKGGNPKLIGRKEPARLGGRLTLKDNLLSDYDSYVASSGGVQRGERKPQTAPAGSSASDAGTVLCARRFDDWMSQWPRNPNNEQAVHAWAFCWTAEEDPQIFACRDRYLASADAKAGVFQNPAKFLNEQRANGWAGKWPPPAEAEKNGYHSHEIDYPDLGGPR